MSLLATFLAGSEGSFNDALDFILVSREAQTGGVEVGGPQIWSPFSADHLLWTHLQITFVSVLIACLVAIPIGVYLGHTGRGSFAVSAVANVGRAVPTFALIVFFVAYIGVGFQNVTLALVLLAIPPILTNAWVGTRQVDREVVDAARGQGLSGWQVVRSVELPLAVPTMFGGVRTSVVNVIATATIAPLAGVNTLGDPILNASVYGNSGRLGAAIVVALLAVLAELGFAALQRALTPRGLTVDAASQRRPRRFLAFPSRRIQET